jgi:hypothetical protein
MIQIVAVMLHKQAVKLDLGWKPGRCNAYTQTMARVCASEEEAQLIARTLPKGTIWALEVAGT